MRSISGTASSVCSASQHILPGHLCAPGLLSGAVAAALPLAALDSTKSSLPAHDKQAVLLRLHQYTQEDETGCCLPGLNGGSESSSQRERGEGSVGSPTGSYSPPGREEGTCAPARPHSSCCSSSATSPESSLLPLRKQQRLRWRRGILERWLRSGSCHAWLSGSHFSHKQGQVGTGGWEWG